ncbi:MAG: hypothetical protein JXD18_07680 [Anaerolineae bacterium]|nr:hypothetical protein [Anaerolineae bacterium]
MATMEEKKLRQLRLFNNLVFGFAKGMYDLFGDAALATVDTIGEDVLEEMEHSLGLEVQGENPQNILTEIERLLIDEYGMAKGARLAISGDTINLMCEGCLLWQATQDLQAAAVPPYTCVPMMMASAALRKRLGQKAKFVSISQDMGNRVCDIEFRMLN